MVFSTRQVFTRGLEQPRHFFMPRSIITMQEFHPHSSCDDMQTCNKTVTITSERASFYCSFFQIVLFIMYDGCREHNINFDESLTKPAKTMLSSFRLMMRNTKRHILLWITWNIDVLYLGDCVPDGFSRGQSKINMSIQLFLLRFICCVIKMFACFV